jgi:hypothetical protein
MQAGRDGEWRQRSRKEKSIVALFQQPRLQHCLGQLFDKERHAIGPGENLAHHLLWQRLAAGEPLDDCHSRLPTEPIQS